MKISIIAAMTKDRVIGQGNKMPWNIPEELQHFKAITMGKPMIMGRTTFDSIGRRLLPGRKTIILSRETKNIEFVIPAQDVIQDPFIVDSKPYFANSIDNALHLAGNAAEVMIVGGANIYKQFLPIANKMYLSIIHKDYPGEVFFPEYDESKWQAVAEEIKTEFTVTILEKIT